MKYFKICILCLLIFYTLEATDLDEQEAVLDKIVSSATGFDMQLKDEARNMLVIDKSQIENKGYQSVEQALRYIPVITFSSRAFGDEIDMRGQGGEAYSSVKVLLNRVPINPMNSHGSTPFNSINIEDVESIEVIPGGGAVVYGNGTRGGVINIVTKQNPKDFAQMTFKGGVYEAPQTGFTQYNLSAGKKLSNKFFLKGNASIQTQQGYRKEEKFTNWFGNIEALYNFNQNHSLNFNATYSYTKSLNSNNISLIQLKEDRRAAGNQGTHKDLDFLMTSLNYKGKVGNTLEFDALGFYQQTSDKFKYVIKNIIGSPILFYTQQGGLNLKGKHTITNNTLMFGIDSIYGGSIIGSKDRKTGSKSATGDSRWSNSIYILDSLKPIKYFDLTGGARYENSYYHIYKKIGSKEMYSKNRMIHSYALELTPNFKYSSTGNIYAKYERGFITPLPIFLIGQGSTGSYINDTLQPSTYNTYEIGWKDEFAWTYLSLTGYYTDTQNEFIINYIDRSKFWYQYENIGTTSRFGIEIIGMQDFFDSLHLAESISYIKTKITKTSIPDQKNKPVPYVNEYKITLNVNYDFFKNNKTLASVFLNNSFLGPRADNGFQKMDAYILGDLGLNLAKNGFIFNIGIRNLYNALYIDYQNYSSKTETATYIPAPNRSYYAEVRYNF
ncbi:TonB-dependent receptor [Helicobacter sp. 13S00477-4]|uniref:TonB-dependent receptor n=1 Tax=Helicobacter sp. 13S00477-4 TaxID=1905759 RepID=UPI000BA739C6|nr:TonB-dependent receptor [Helicobacter sp. 13S00477-4]PAF52458.1 hypothetical protein BKH44_02750 [Helicobacter sp. 13S00477-4]